MKNCQYEDLRKIKLEYQYLTREDGLGYIRDADPEEVMRALGYNKIALFYIELHIAYLL
jgi:hypothetical protein